jgi:uncharacterized membrane protein YkvA (DUF1232 family)
VAVVEGWRERARALRRETYVYYRAARDPRTPWLARAVALATVAYALSPLDLIPDVIPVVGYLDDLLLVPAGLLLARRLIPDEVIEAHRDALEGEPGAGTQLGGIGRAGLAIVVTAWVLTAVLIGVVMLRLL